MKVSIITAVYNSEATVCEAIGSVAAQSHCEMEHLIVEGKSTDGSLAAINRAAHNRMLLISEPDSGIYDALNKGIQTATGEVIGFVHSDDFLANNKVVERIASEFADPAVEAVFGSLDYVARDTSRVIRHWAGSDFTPRKLRHGWMPAHPTLYVRRHVYERLGGFDTSFRIAADYDFILRFFSQTTARTVCIPEVLYKMRIGGVSNRNLGKIVEKMGEDRRALRKNGIGGAGTIAWKNLSKIRQFFPRLKQASRDKTPQTAS